MFVSIQAPHSKYHTSAQWNERFVQGLNLVAYQRPQRESPGPQQVPIHEVTSRTLESRLKVIQTRLHTRTVLHSAPRLSFDYK